jgi:hypothetical protein
MSISNEMSCMLEFTLFSLIDASGFEMFSWPTAVQFRKIHSFTLLLGFLVIFNCYSFPSSLSFPFSFIIVVECCSVRLRRSFTLQNHSSCYFGIETDSFGKDEKFCTFFTRSISIKWMANVSKLASERTSSQRAKKLKSKLNLNWSQLLFN